MTRQELIEMTGSEEQAAYAMEILLRNCKETFVKMAIQAELKKIDGQIEAFKQEGIIYEENHSYSVDWDAPERVFGNEPGAYWHATDEQKAEAERLEGRCMDAAALLYTRNRTVDLIAVR